MRTKVEEIRLSPYKYYNTKLLEQTEDTKGRTVVTYSEIAEVDLRGMYKIKDVAMINRLIKLLPDGVNKEIFFLMLKGNRKNIVIDTTKTKQGVVQYLANKWDMSERSIQRGLKDVVEDKWLYRLNKFQYMSNPYYITRNDISMKKISELQTYWDRLEKDNIKVPITFSTEDVDDLVKQDLTKIAENIDKRQAYVANTKALKAKQIAEDTMVVSQHKEALKAIFDSFITYNKYDKIDTKVRVHFKSYLKKLFDNESYLVSEIPTLYLTSIKPLKQLEE